MPKGHYDLRDKVNKTGKMEEYQKRKNRGKSTERQEEGIEDVEGMFERMENEDRPEEQEKTTPKEKEDDRIEMMMRMLQQFSTAQEERSQRMEEKMTAQEERSQRIEEKMTAQDERSQRMEEKMTEQSNSIKEQMSVNLAEHRQRMEENMTEMKEQMIAQEERSQRMEENMTAHITEQNRKMEENLREQMWRQAEIVEEKLKEVNNQMYRQEDETRKLKDDVKEINKSMSVMRKEVYGEVGERMRTTKEEIRSELKEHKEDIEERFQKHSNDLMNVYKEGASMNRREMQEKLREGMERQKQEVEQRIEEIEEDQEKHKNNVYINQRDIRELKDQCATHKEEIKILKTKNVEGGGNGNEIYIHWPNSMDSTLPTFNGRNRNPREFLRKFRNYYDRVRQRRGNGIGQNYEELLDNALQDNAARWWSVMKDEIKSLEEFEAVFCNKYWNSDIQKGIRRRMEVERYRPNGRLSRNEYFIERVLLLSQMTPKIEEGEIVNTLVEHFSQRIKDAVRVQNIGTIRSFEDLLAREDLEERNQELRENLYDRQVHGGAERKEERGYMERTRKQEQDKVERIGQRRMEERKENRFQYDREKNQRWNGNYNGYNRYNGGNHRYTPYKPEEGRVRNYYGQIDTERKYVNNGDKQYQNRIYQNRNQGQYQQRENMYGQTYGNNRSYNYSRPYDNNRRQDIQQPRYPTKEQEKLCQTIEVKKEGTPDRGTSPERTRQPLEN